MLAWLLGGTACVLRGAKGVVERPGNHSNAIVAFVISIAARLLHHSVAFPRETPNIIMPVGNTLTCIILVSYPFIESLKSL